MKKNRMHHWMLAASIMSTTPVTPEECQLHQKFLQEEISTAE